MGYRAGRTALPPSWSVVHGVKASTTPERVWKKLYVQNMTPQEAAEQAAVSAYNARPASDRLRR
jgi:hypothetical protein